ncbi:ThiF family adenylyltransferase [Paenibacillus sp. 1A_MP2]|uniref:ThiF family adenylyltransferase n=1 Tax=Paenibacillus sp. 1A_MP2 TaxID=3457495 RepID=UPI003FCCD2B5
MINLLDYHAKNEDSTVRQSRIQSMYYYIVIVGAGGTGGYAVQRITKMLSAFASVDSFLMIADPDMVEEKNLLRQPFANQDIGGKKASVLAQRYGRTYGLKIGSYVDKYVESVEQLDQLFSLTDFRHKTGQHIQKVLIGAVDNDFTRNIMHEYFMQSDDLIYIDAGIEGVFLPSGDKPKSEWGEEEITDNMESGYSGQVVVGLKKNGTEILEPLNGIYPIDATDLIAPSHNCGLEPYQPQRMIANEMAAFHISTIINELLSTNTIIVHYVNFNARTGSCRPQYVQEG